MIRQQIYGRTDRGLYISGPDDPDFSGMDTLAKSKNLSDSFVASVLKGHCVYEPPDKLAGYIEENRDQYPVNTYCFWAPTGELVVGRSLFVRSDGGGDDAYLTHNLVVPPQSTAELVPTFMDLPYVTDFVSRYPGSTETVLPDLTAFHYDVEKCGLGLGESLLLKFGVNETVFKSMLLALMDAIREGNRVYVVPNVRTGHLHDAACVLIKFLVAALPYAFRRKLGFATYLKRDIEPEGINLCFLEGGYAAYTQKSKLGEYLFDFVGNDIWQPEAHGRTPAASLYVQSAWEQRKQERGKLYEFLNSVTGGGNAGEPPVNQSTLDTLTVLWHINLSGEDAALGLYRRNRAFVLDTLCQTAKKRNAALLAVVKGVFAKAMDAERRDLADGGAGANGDAGKGTWQAAAYFPEFELLARFASYAEGLKSNDTDAEVVNLCADVLNIARSADKVEYISGFFALAVESPRVFKKIQTALAERYGGTFDGVLFHYVLTRLKDCDTIPKLTAEIEFWWSNKPTILDDADVTAAFGAEIKRLFLASREKVAEGARFHTRMEYVLRNAGAKAEKRVIYDFTRALLETVDRVVLDSLSGDNVTYEALQTLKIDSETLRNEEKYKTLEALKGFLCSDHSYVEEKSLKALRDQGTHAFKQTSAIARRILAGRIAPENYDRIIELYSEQAQGGGAGETDFDGIFEFINTNKNRGESCNFIKWAFRNARFSGQALTDFSNATVTFFNAFTPKEFRIVLKNYAYLYANPDALSDSDKNLKLIIDVFRERNAFIPRPRIASGMKGLGVVLLVAVAIVIGIVLVFALVSTLLN